MRNRSTRARMPWPLGPFGAVLATAGILGVSLASAAEPPSLDEIKTRLKQQREKIESLYIETEIETTSPLSLEELRKLPGFERHSWVPNAKEQFAFKHGKRYSRHQRFGIRSAPLRVPKLYADATPIEKALRDFWLEQEKSREAREASLPPGPRPETIGHDQMEGLTSRAYWVRTISENRHSDGRVEKTQPSVSLWPPRPRYLGIRYLRYIGLAIPGLQIPGETPRSQQDFRNLLPELLERGPYSVQDEFEEVDGVRCVVLEGTVERTSTVRDATQKYTTRDKLWLDPERRLALRKREQRTSPDRTKSLRRTVNSNFEEVAPGIWLPRDSQHQTVAPSDNPDFPEAYRGKAILSTRVKLTKCIVNQVPDKVFEPYIKPGDVVSDGRER